MSLSNLTYILIRCLILTIVIELIVGLILSIRNKKDIFSIIIVNVITNPIVVLSQSIIRIKTNYTIEVIGIIILEILVVLVEGLIYKKVLKYKELNPFIFSLLLNSSSFFIGELINML